MGSPSKHNNQQATLDRRGHAPPERSCHRPRLVALSVIAIVAGAGVGSARGVDPAARDAALGEATSLGPPAPLEATTAGATQRAIKSDVPVEVGARRPGASSGELVRSESQAPLGPARTLATPAATNQQDENQKAGFSPSAWLTSSIGPLAVVVGLIVMIAAAVRFAARRTGGLASALGPGGRAPSGVVSVLARYPLARTTTLVLLKVDRRVILLSHEGGIRRSSSSLHTLCEFTDADEVASLVAKTGDVSSITAKFESVLSRATSEEPAKANREARSTATTKSAVDARERRIDIREGQAQARATARPAGAKASAPAIGEDQAREAFMRTLAMVQRNNSAPRQAVAPAKGLPVAVQIEPKSAPRATDPSPAGERQTLGPVAANAADRPGAAVGAVSAGGISAAAAAGGTLSGIAGPAGGSGAPSALDALRQRLAALTPSRDATPAVKPSTFREAVA
ncbi:MAG: hypothetical protein SFZ23_14905 [Planctomycetota bacterium]|nr:hypothetical protein [Planctomycetota bacterium]